MAGSRQMTREEALSYIKSAAGHLIVTDRKVVGMALLEAQAALLLIWAAGWAMVGVSILRRKWRNK